MRIDKINIYPITLPFWVNFSHAQKKRSSIKNIVVEIVAEKDKIKGYGEGAPRSYVTGESQESIAKSIRHFIREDTFPQELNEISQIWDFIDTITHGKAHNAAICALEAALLDALGKSQDRYIIDYFSKNFIMDDVYYSGALPLAGKQRIIELCRLIKRMKIDRLRLKLATDFAQNKEIIETVLSVLGENIDLRADINCAWDIKLACKHLSLIKNNKIKVVEQPMMPDEPAIAEFANLLKTEGVILMADESACSLGDVEKIAKEGHYNMINVKLSKCGGFRNSLKIIDDLRTNGISFQIGCQMGESGILSAAGRVLSLLCRDAEYYDGSYDEFMLKENTTFENVSFGPAGRAGPMNRPGLGVNVNPQQLKNRCNDSDIISISTSKFSRR